MSGKLLFHRLPRTGSGDEKKPIVYYDLEKREEKTILDDADGFELSANREKLLVQKGKRLRHRRAQGRAEDGQEDQYA